MRVTPRMAGASAEPAALELLRGEDGDLADGPRARAPRLLARHLGVDRSHQRVDVRVDAAVRVQLVADQAARPERQHPEALVLQRGPVLERVEVAPHGVELARVPERLPAEGARVALRDGEVLVAPEAARQRLQLEVRVGAGGRADVRADVAGVVEDRRVRRRLAHERRHPGPEAVDRRLRERVAGRRVLRVEPRLRHPREAPAADARRRLDDVEEQPVHGQRVLDLAGVRAQEPHVGRVEAELAVEAGLERAAFPPARPSGVTIRHSGCSAAVRWSHCTVV